MRRLNPPFAYSLVESRSLLSKPLRPTSYTTYLFMSQYIPLSPFTLHSSMSIYRHPFIRQKLNWLSGYWGNIHCMEPQSRQDMLWTFVGFWDLAGTGVDDEGILGCLLHYNPRI